MRNKHAWAVACGIFFWVGSQGAWASDTYVLEDSNTSTEWTFTNTLGTASTTNGTMIVFEGQLDAGVNVTSAWSSAAGAYLATVQLLVEVKLFDELPTSNEVGNVQGAVAALRDGTGATTGSYYAWGLSNSVPAWVPLLSTNGTQFTVEEGATNYVTFVFAYPTDSTPITYQVFIGNYGDDWMEPSESITSVISGTDGIESVSLLGSGVLQSVGSASGAPSALSSKLSMSVYYSSNNVCADVYTVSESGTGPIRIFAKINGVWVEVGRIDDVAGEFDNVYHVILSGLKPGETYQFMVYDEAGRVYTESLTVATIKIGSSVIDMEMQMLAVTFNSEPGAHYEVRVSSDVGAAASLWTVEDVDVYKDGSWSGSLTNSFMAGASETTIRIPKNRTRAFFRIYKKD